MDHELRTSKENLSLGELFADLSRETSTLVRQEVSLAKAEIGQKASRLGKGVAFLAVGGLLAYAGLLALLGAIIAGCVAAGMAVWAASLLVGVVVLVVSGVLAASGLKAMRNSDPVPHETIETLKEDQQWVKEQVS